MRSHFAEILLQISIFILILILIVGYRRVAEECLFAQNWGKIFQRWKPGDGSQDICKNTESNLGPFAGL